MAPPPLGGLTGSAVDVGATPTSDQEEDSPEPDEAERDFPDAHQIASGFRELLFGLSQNLGVERVRDAEDHVLHTGVLIDWFGTRKEQGRGSRITVCDTSRTDSSRHDLNATLVGSRGVLR